LGAAAHLFTADPPFLADIVFHAQQGAEKSFKGFLTWRSTPFRKTHSIEEIGEQCVRLDPTLKPLVDKAVPLTKYVWKFRYPDDSDEPTREEAEKALALAREVFDAVLGSLPPDVRP
jgi:HEPN domain-containing protein